MEKYMWSIRDLWGTKLFNFVLLKLWKKKKRE